MRAIMIFIDGIGLGENDPEKNPFVFTPTPGISGALGGMPLCKEAAGYHGEKISLLSVDATLGIPGTPQSATGQASLFTGYNAPRMLGNHLNRYPNKELKKMLRSRGILTELKKKGLSPAFINAYRPVFFEDLEAGLQRSHACSTMMNYYAGLPFRTLEDVKAGEAIYMDITNEYLVRTGCPMTIIAPKDAAKILINLSNQFDFVLFEYFLSDIAGHLAEREHAVKIITTLDEFLGVIIENISSEDTLLCITSDHGNLEEINHKDHTINPVPALILGPDHFREKASAEINDLTGITPLIKTFLLENR